MPHLIFHVNPSNIKIYPSCHLQDNVKNNLRKLQMRKVQVKNLVEKQYLFQALEFESTSCRQFYMYEFTAMIAIMKIKTIISHLN